VRISSTTVLLQVSKIEIAITLYKKQQRGKQICLSELAALKKNNQQLNKFQCILVQIYSDSYSCRNYNNINLGGRP
jgi:hypothetical protein